jgi:hypothetical protein
MTAEKYLTRKELRELRQNYYDLNRSCPLTGQIHPIEEFVIDHDHWSGLIRGCIHRNANTIEGRIARAWVRYGGTKLNISLPDFLRNLADYYEDNLSHQQQLYYPKQKRSRKKRVQK